jgi:hypothetical protein
MNVDFWNARWPRYTRLAWSGSRHGQRTERLRAACAQALQQLCTHHVVYVGSAPCDSGGIDAQVRAAATAALVFGAANRTRAALVGRSVRMVDQLIEAFLECPARPNPLARGLLVALPGIPCPARVVPSRDSRQCWNGSGSGTWATAAYAVGNGLDALVWLEPGATLDLRDIPPPWWGDWKRVDEAGWWWLSGRPLARLAGS